MADFDLAIIGGGINGAGIARDAAGRGLRVLLVEQGDLASGTSSASSKLIHGGLRYLEQMEFRLVREALDEREVLLRIAPHVVQPMRFVLPPQAGLRSPWLLRFGLFLYDHLGRRRLLPSTRTLNFTDHPLAKPLRHRYRRGFEYSDCKVDDARLVILNALDAAERGAVIRTHTKFISAERSDVWTLILSVHGRRDVATALALVNAAGPWVTPVGANVAGPPTHGSRVRLDAGSHIVVPKLFDHDRGYILQVEDGRVVFALPYEQDFTLIGTTDRGFAGDPATVHPSDAEIGYLCNVSNEYFRRQIKPGDVVWSYAGIRALYDDGADKAQELTRDYHLELDDRPDVPPLLTVIGGKITTYRRLAEEALAQLAWVIPMGRPWTATTPLPGGAFAFDGLSKEVKRALDRWPFLPEALIRRLLRAYGLRIERIIGDARSLADLGPVFGADLTAAEVRYLMRHEWAQSEDDVLWRRSKLGLHVTSEQRAALGRFMADDIGNAGV